MCMISMTSENKMIFFIPELSFRNKGQKFARNIFYSAANNSGTVPVKTIQNIN